MLLKLLITVSLVAATVAIHAIGLSLIIRRMIRFHAQPANGFWHITWRLIRAAWWLILCHSVEICIWGYFYYLQGCMPDLNSAFYFAGVTYTTLGYGDLVLPLDWRILGPVEGLTGILMCGLSTGFFFVFVSRMLGRHVTGEPEVSET